MNIWFALAIGIIIGSPLICLVFGVSMLDTKKAHDEDWYLVGLAGCVLIGILFAIIGCCVRHESDVTLYDVEIRVHYVDGHSNVIRKDSIAELPYVKEYYCHQHYRYSHPTGTYSLYIGNDKIPGVIRFEYLKKREYNVPYKKLYAF